MLAYHGSTARVGMKMELRRLDHRMDYVGQIPLLVHIPRGRRIGGYWDEMRCTYS